MMMGGPTQRIKKNKGGLDTRASSPAPPPKKTQGHKYHSLKLIVDNFNLTIAIMGYPVKIRLT